MTDINASKLSRGPIAAQIEALREGSGRLGRSSDFYPMGAR